MILLDFSGLLHQRIHSTVSYLKPQVDHEGKYVTSDYIGAVIGWVLNDMFELQRDFKKYAPQARDFVVCLDSKNNWRKDILSTYKGSRKTTRNESPIRYDEVFEHITSFTDMLRQYLPYRIVQADRAEGDDVILILCQRFAKTEPTLILSSDKDMIQASQYGRVKQYSLLTKRFINYGTKGEISLEDWLIDHVVLGDKADEVPRVIDGTTFSKDFLEFLAKKKLDLTPELFWELKEDTRTKIGDKFMESYPDGCPFDSQRFGSATLRKKIKEFGSLDAWLDSNKLYRKNYERNKKLVLAEYIPEYVRASTLAEFDHAAVKFNEFAARAFLSKYDQSMINFPDNFYYCTSFEDAFSI